MKMKRVLGVTMLILFITIILFNALSFAGGTDVNVSGVLGEVKKEAANKVGGEDDIKKLGATIVYVIKLVGLILGTILIAWFGVQWITGSAQTRAVLKERTWYYVAGAGLLFGAATIADWVYKLVTNAMG